jgi:hypothetical protein
MCKGGSFIGPAVERVGKSIGIERDARTGERRLPVLEIAQDRHLCLHEAA